MDQGQIRSDMGLAVLANMKGKDCKGVLLLGGLCPFTIHPGVDDS
jgi:hypothetical protein